MSASEMDPQDLPAVVQNLMLCYRDRWLRFVQRMVQNQSDAEDVLQEAVLRLLARDLRFDSPEHARMYLSRVICNTAIELYHMRRRQRRQQCPVDEQLLAASDTGEPDRCLCELEESTAQSHLLDLLREGLARLPFKQYQALRLTVLSPEILSIRDAGAANSIPYSTLRHRSLQGIRQLKRFLNRALRAAPTKLVMA